MLNIWWLSEPSIIWNIYKENFSEYFYIREININEDAIYTDDIYNICEDFYRRERHINEDTIYTDDIYNICENVYRRERRCRFYINIDINRFYKNILIYKVEYATYVFKIDTFECLVLSIRVLFKCF